LPPLWSLHIRDSAGQTLASEILSGRYALEERLGHGATSNVYRALDRILERDVVVKILVEHLSQDVEFIERFKREALAAAALSHANIVPVLDIGADDGRLYIVVAHVSGISLDTLIAEGELSIREARGVISQAAAGLDYMHGRGVIHCDVKPGNLIITREAYSGDGFHARLSDFGVARQLERTRIGSDPVGTPGYMCPEAWRGEEPTPRFDVYSLAVVAHRLIVGGYPVRNTRGGIQFSGETHTLPKVAQVLEHGLKDDPEQRTTSCVAFAENLRGAFK